ncbi:MAG TPA: sigma-70 family RNA polymerase sigma factor [Flavipsychrobacter sp.]|nr:sigma-70 family RNA polymerase sigma factor [Flavipsychrobacter sp.]
MYQPLYTEQQLLAGLAKGERMATDVVYRQHIKIVGPWILQNGGSESDVGDVFQEAMVVLYEKAQQEDFRLSCKIGTYLFAVCKYIWYKKLQGAQKQPGFLPDNAGNDEGRDWAYEDDVNAYKEREAHYQNLDIALDHLGEPCRSLLKAFYHNDKSMQEIAAEFGYTNPDNAKTQKYKCLNRLRKIFYGAQTKMR